MGVTGTNGKTSTTTWLAAALARRARPVVRATTLGYFLDDVELDLPKDYDGFVETMRTCHARGGRLAAIELTSEALARGFAVAWPCTVGVFTNLTHDHLDAHGTPEHYLASKAQLFVHLPKGGTAVINGCDAAGELIAEVIPPHVRVLRYGVPSRRAGEDAPTSPIDLLATSVEIGWGGTTAYCELSAALADLPNGAMLRTVTVRAIGEIYAENALAALLGAIAAGVDPGEAVSALAAAPAPPGRFEVLEGDHPSMPHVVIDYAHSPDALARTLATARALCTKDAKVTVVFGAGGRRDREKRAPMGAAARIADRVLLTSDNPRNEDPAEIARAIAAGLEGHPGVHVELDRAKAIARAIREAGPDDVVVIAGKGHETEQIGKSGPRPFSDAEVARACLRVAR